MGTILSRDVTEFTGEMKDTVEEAAQSLEHILKVIYPNAFITIGDPEMTSILSPRGPVSRLAYAKIGDGKDYRVVFRRDGKSFRASVSC